MYSQRFYITLQRLRGVQNTRPELGRARGALHMHAVLRNEGAAPYAWLSSSVFRWSGANTCQHEHVTSTCAAPFVALQTSHEEDCDVAQPVETEPAVPAHALSCKSFNWLLPLDGATSTRGWKLPNSAPNRAPPCSNESLRSGRRTHVLYQRTGVRFASEVLHFLSHDSQDVLCSTHAYPLQET